MGNKLKILNATDTAVGAKPVDAAVGLPVADQVPFGSHNLAPEAYRGNAAIVTLGCAKNQVDSEVMLGALRQRGYEIVADLAMADVAIVNTCGFLESAVRESLDAILDASSFKVEGRLRRLIVAGCMVERYRGDLKATLPEVDAFLRTNDLLEAGGAALGEFDAALDDAARPYFIYDERMPRVRSTAQHFAYVKVAEGCNRPCTFCVIPSIRGKMRSRSIASIVDEVQALADDGVREINLVAQDLTDYGSDRIKDGENLARLLEALQEVQELAWIRLLYAYPLGVNEELVKTIVSLPKVCTYLDIPLQHSSESVLKAMQRPLGKFSPRRLVESMRTWSNDALAIRTTFIVGFPGETESDVQDLADFVGEGHFSSVGVFTYSREEGTPSHDLSAQVADAAKEPRRALVMAEQQRVALARAAGLVGTVQKVLVEGTHEESDLILVGRTSFQAPEVDGRVLINDVVPSVAPLVHAGKFFEVAVTEVVGYDLMGRIVSAM